MIRPVFSLFLASLALMAGGLAVSLWDMGNFVGARFGLSGFEGLVALDIDFRRAEGVDYYEGYPWYVPPLANWVVIFGLVLFVSSIAIAAAVRRPRPSKKRGAATA